MWAGIKHVLKPRGAVVMFGSEPFSSLLRVSNLDWYKYDWVWDKVNRFTNYGNVSYMPLTAHELITVFCSHATTYNPQMDIGKPYVAKRSGVITSVYADGGLFPQNGVNEGIRYPTTIVKVKADDKKNAIHPTQKPVALLEYLVKTYTNPGDTVLDFTMGSCSTGKAAIKNCRNFIGIDNGYCEKENSEFYGWSWVQYAEMALANLSGGFTLTPAEKDSGQLPLWESMT